MIHTINVPFETACLEGFDQAVADAAGCGIGDVHCDIDTDGTAELRVDCADLAHLRAVVSAVRDFAA